MMPPISTPMRSPMMTSISLENPYFYSTCRIKENKWTHTWKNTQGGGRYLKKKNLPKSISMLVDQLPKKSRAAPLWRKDLCHNFVFLLLKLGLPPWLAEPDQTGNEGYAYLSISTSVFIHSTSNSAPRIKGLTFDASQVSIDGY